MVVRKSRHGAFWCKGFCCTFDRASGLEKDGIVCLDYITCYEIRNEELTEDSQKAIYYALMTNWATNGNDPSRNAGFGLFDNYSLEQTALRFYHENEFITRTMRFFLRVHLYKPIVFQ